jgi:hypothetical protein
VLLLLFFVIKNFSLELNSKKAEEKIKKIIQRKFSTDFSNYLENKKILIRRTFKTEEEKSFENPKPGIIKNLNTHNSCVL